MSTDLLAGEVPTHWEFTTLGEVCRRGGGNIQTGPFGSQLHASDYVPDGIPTIMPTNIGDNRIVEDGIARVTEADAARLSQHRVQVGDIVYSRRGDVEKRALIRERETGWLCGTGCLKVRLGRGTVVPSYASYFLGHPAIRAWIVRHAIGATMPNLNTTIMSAVPFVLPPLAEQRVIARLLGALDDKIELNRRMSETLEELSRALFKSWFVDFDPVRANVKGRAPSGMGAATAQLFPGEFVDSELGAIPKGWKHQTLKDLVELQRGTTYQSKLKGLGGPVLLGLGAIARNGGFRDNKLITYGGESPAKLLLRPGELFVSLKDVTQSADLLGAIAKVPAHVPSGRLTQDTVKLTLHNPSIGQLVYRTLLGAPYREFCRSHATGTTNLGLAREDFLSYPVIVPNESVIECFNELARNFEARSATAVAESRVLVELRDLLLEKLFSGELSVVGIEGAVQAA